MAAISENIWYVVTLLMKCTIFDEDAEKWDCDEQVRILQVPNDEAAYLKALDIGKKAEHSYENVYGDPVSWEFVGLENLERLKDNPFQDGEEIMGRIISIENPLNHIRQKDDLLVFKTQRWKNRKAHQIIEELEAQENRDEYRKSR